MYPREIINDQEFVSAVLALEINYSYRLPINYIDSVMYLVKLRIKHANEITFSTPNRLKSLRMTSCQVCCINNNIYTDNDTEKRVRLSKSIVLIKLSKTGVNRPPKGFFISMLMSIYHHYALAKYRESILEIDHRGSIIMKFNKMPRSVKDFYLRDYPSSHILRLYDLPDLAIYNVYPYIVKIKSKYWFNNYLFKHRDYKICS